MKIAGLYDLQNLHSYSVNKGTISSNNPGFNNNGQSSDNRGLWGKCPIVKSIKEINSARHIFRHRNILEHIIQS